MYRSAPGQLNRSTAAIKAKTHETEGHTLGVWPQPKYVVLQLGKDFPAVVVHTIFFVLDYVSSPEAVSDTLKQSTEYRGNG